MKKNKTAQNRKLVVLKINPENKGFVKISEWADFNKLNTSEESKENLLKEFSHAGFLSFNRPGGNIKWAVEQLKKGEIVRNSAWPEEKIGIIMKVQPHPSAEVKLITEGDVSFQYKFTNEDVLFGAWEIVK